MLFFISPFWGTRELEKPWLQQFSNHPISKSRSFQMLWAIQTSWDALRRTLWVLPCVRAGWNCEKIFFIFFYSMPSRFPFFSSHSFPRHHAEWLSGAAWRLICSHVNKSSIPQSHHPPSYSFSPSIIFLDTLHNLNCALIFNIIPPCMTILSLACISILFLNSVLEHSVGNF